MRPAGIGRGLGNRARFSAWEPPAPAGTLSAMTTEELQFAACLTILRHCGPDGLLCILRARDEAMKRQANTQASAATGEDGGSVPAEKETP